MPPSNKRKAQTEASEVVEQIKANGAFTRHTTPGISSYNMYALPDAAVYEFLENDYMLPTPMDGEIEVVQDERDCIKRFVRREDDILEEDEGGNMVEVIKAPINILVTKTYSNQSYFSKSIDMEWVREQMANESCCLVDGALDTRLIDKINGLPLSKRKTGPADVRCHREFSMHFLCKDTLIEYFETITGLKLRDVKVLGRGMQVGSYEILNDSSHMQDTLYAILTVSSHDPLKVLGGMTRFLAADGEELINYAPKHDTLFTVYASQEPIRVYTELVKDCVIPFRQVILKFTTID